MNQIITYYHSLTKFSKISENIEWEFSIPFVRWFTLVAPQWMTAMGVFLFLNVWVMCLALLFQRGLANCQQM